MPGSRGPEGPAPGLPRWGNELLDALAAAVDGTPLQDLLQPALEVAPVALNAVVHRAGAPVEHVWFPTSSAFGLMSVVPGAAPVESMPVASEGLVGLAAVLGDGVSPLVGCAIYDGRDLSNARLLYGDAEILNRATDAARRETETLAVPVLNRTWTVYFVSLPEFDL